MAERPKAAVLKTVGRASAPWVRILLPPPVFVISNGHLQSCYVLFNERKSNLFREDLPEQSGEGFEVQLSFDLILLEQFPKSHAAYP